MLHCLKLLDIPGEGSFVMMLKTHYRKRKTWPEMMDWVGKLIEKFIVITFLRMVALVYSFF